MNAIAPTPSGKLGDILGHSVIGPAGKGLPQAPTTGALTRSRPGPGLLTSLRAILPACSPNITEGAKGAPPQAALKGPSISIVRRAVEALPNTSELFPTRESYRDILYAVKASLPDEQEEALDIAMQWCLRWPGDINGPNDPVTVEQDWRRMKPPFRRGWSWLAEMAEKHGPPAAEGGFTRALGWADLEAMAAVNARVAGEKKKKAAHMADASNWPDPFDLFGHADPLELGTPPAGSLPSTILAFAEDEARRKGVSVAFAAAAAIGTCGSALGASLRIQPRLNDTGWTEPAALWLCLVAPPGSGKSPMISAAIAPLAHLNADWASQDRPRHAQWATAAAAHRRSPKSAPHPGPEPRLRRALVDDVTMEKLIGILAGNPRGVLRAPDELIGFLASFGAYKNSGDGDRTQALRLFDGGAIALDRVGSGSTYAPSALMGVVAGTQPERIRALAKNLGDDGLLQRFIFILDDGAERRGQDLAPDRSAASEYASALRAFASLHPGRVITLEPAARAVLEQTERDIAAFADLPGVSAAWQGHVNKWPKFLIRLTLIFHAVEGYVGWGLVGDTVGSEVAAMAARFAMFLIRHGLTFYETYHGASTSDSHARSIAGWLLTRPDLASVTQRDLYNARTELRGDEKRPVLLAAMRELEGCAWVSVAEWHASTGPRRWDVNPKIHGHFVQHANREKMRRANEQQKIEKAAAARRSLAGRG